MCGSHARRAGENPRCAVCCRCSGQASCTVPRGGTWGAQEGSHLQGLTSERSNVMFARVKIDDKSRELHDPSAAQTGWRTARLSSTHTPTALRSPGIPTSSCHDSQSCVSCPLHLSCRASGSCQAVVMVGPLPRTRSTKVVWCGSCLTSTSSRDCSDG